MWLGQVWLCMRAVLVEGTDWNWSGGAGEGSDSNPERDWEVGLDLRG